MPSLVHHTLAKQERKKSPGGAENSLPGEGELALGSGPLRSKGAGAAVRSHPGLSPLAPPF